MRSVFPVSVFAFLLLAGCGDNITNKYGPPDWQPPVVEWRYQPDAEVRGTVGIDVTVTDSSQIARVALYVDGILADSLFAPPYRFEIVTDSLLDGVHVCETRAWDEYGNLGISPVLRINVMNSVAQGPRLIWVPDDFTLIQAAINAATDYDTIRVRDGVYYEALNLFGKGIWVESEHGPLTCTISAGGLTNVFFVPPAQIPATIRGFTLAAAFNVIFMDDGAQLNVFNNMFISDSTLDSSYTLLYSGFAGGYFINNLLSGSRYAVVIASILGNLENNILQYALDVALWNSALSGNTIFHGFNLFWQNTQNYTVNFSPGPGEFDADPLIDIVSGTLLPGSPCIDAGNPEILDINGTRSDIGPFGGPWAYDN